MNTTLVGLWILLLAALPARAQVGAAFFATEPPGCIVSVRLPDGRWLPLDREGQLWRLPPARFRGHRRLWLRFDHVGYHPREIQVPAELFTARGRFPPGGERVTLDPVVVEATFNTSPPGARIYHVTDTGQDYLGLSGKAIPMNVGALSGSTPSGSFTLRFELWGYRPLDQAFTGYQFGPDRENKLGPLPLTPVFPLVPFVVWVKHHPLLAGLFIVASIRLIVRWWLRRRAQRRALERALYLEELQARARGSDSLVGRRLGALRLTRELGRGGMARVYEGRPDEELLESEEAVAVKVLDRELDSSILDRFKREVKILQQLHHPAIVRLQDWNFDGDIQPPFLVMELVRGRTLRELLEEAGGVKESPMVSLLRQIYEGIAFAHSRGVVHRDLKPENIMVTDKGRVKIMDFGLARMHHLASVTRTGQVLGTPAYMAPEQFQEVFEIRSDQYALGIITYEVLCGRRPFESEDPLALAMAHLSAAPPPIRRYRPELPEELEAVLLRMLAKSPKDRFPTVEACWEVLEPWLHAPECVL